MEQLEFLSQQRTDRFHPGDDICRHRYPRCGPDHDAGSTNHCRTLARFKGSESSKLIVASLLTDYAIIDCSDPLIVEFADCVFYLVCGFDANDAVLDKNSAHEGAGQGNKAEVTSQGSAL